MQPYTESLPLRRASILNPVKVVCHNFSQL